MSSWRSVTFGDVFEIQLGKMLDAEKNVGVMRPYLANRNVRWGHCDTSDLPQMRFTPADQRRFDLQRGDLLVCEGGEVGRTAIWNGEVEDCYYQKAIHRLRPTDDVNPRFVLHYMRWAAERNLFARLTSWTSIAHLTKAKLQKVPLPLPPLPEQKRIAAILDAADALRAKRREALTQLDTLLQSTFLDMFGDPVTNPMGWDVTSVGDEISFMTSGSRGWASYYADSGDIFIRIQNLKGGRLDLEDIAFVAAPDSAEARRTRVEPGDVLLSITADLGRTAVVPDSLGKAHINQHLAILRFRELNPVFVSYQLASKGGQSQFDRLNREGVKAGLNFNDVKSIRVTKPPGSMQLRFAQAVEAIERQKVKLLAHLAELDTLFASLQSRAFRGEL